MSESVFVAKVQRSRRIVIPKPICEALRINEGDSVRVKISKEEAEEKLLPVLEELKSLLKSSAEASRQMIESFKELKRSVEDAPIVRGHGTQEEESSSEQKNIFESEDYRKLSAHEKLEVISGLLEKAGRFTA